MIAVNIMVGWFVGFDAVVCSVLNAVVIAEVSAVVLADIAMGLVVVGGVIVGLYAVDILSSVQL